MNAGPFSLADKRILVTGASSGIGRQCCISASQLGAQIVATGRNAERLAETERALAGEGHRTVVADLTSEEGFEAVVAAAGELDGIVHSAGVTVLLPFRFTTREVLREQHRINFEVPVLLTRSLVNDRKLKRGASVVFLSSTAALQGRVGQTAYASDKAALIAVVRIIAKELSSRRTRINCLCPGMVRTPMLEGSLLTKEDYERDEALYPLGYGEPEDVAHAAVFLLSDASRWITGTSLLLDGGRLL